MKTGKIVGILMAITSGTMLLGSLIAYSFYSLGAKPAVLLLLFGLALLLFAIPVIMHYNSKGQTEDTQRIISDKSLLRLFEAQPGGLFSVKMLAEKTGLTTGQARSRAMALTHAGVLRAGTNSNMMRYFFELTGPLEEITDLGLSTEPFLTVGDLQKIFRAYEYKVSPQDLIMATGLPWPVLVREMEHFRKKEVIEGVRIARPNDSPVQYILLEPYLSAPPEGEEMLALDAEMREILYDENLLV